MRFNYRSRPAAQRAYDLGLKRALQEAPALEKLINVKRNLENNEYSDDWDYYEDICEDKKANVYQFFFFVLFALV